MIAERGGWVLGCGVWVLGCEFWGLGSGAQDLGFGESGASYEVFPQESLTYGILLILCRARMDHSGLPRSDSGLGFQVKDLET